MKITPRGRQKLQSIIAETPNGVLQVGLSKKGCAGFKFVLKPADFRSILVDAYDHDGIRLVVEVEDEPLVRDLTLDCPVGTSERLVFTSSDLKSCGCGESFTVTSDE